jgi:hypothetical protein
MTSKTATAGALVLVGLALVLWGGLAHAQESAQGGKKVMMIFTTDTNGELNPCG